MVANPTKIINPKRRRFTNKYLMTQTNANPKDLLMDTPDEVLHNILSRLSTNPLMRLKCVSTYWNSQIKDSYFKSCRKVLFSKPFLYALDDQNVYSRVDLPFPFQNFLNWKYRTILVGTLNGIVILAQQREQDFQLILYNPLTRAVKKLPDPPRLCCISNRTRYAYGFGYGYGYGYGATPNDWKIVIGYAKQPCNCFNNKYCHVFSLKTRSWTTPKTNFLRETFREDVGVFLNGYLHWISGILKMEIVILDIEKMKVPKMDVPDGSDWQSSRLGTLDGCLHMINKRHSGFDVWEVINTKPARSWWKKYWFTFGIERDYNHLHVISILKDGRIVVMDSESRHFIFYDPSKGEGSHDIFKYECISPSATCIEYVDIVASFA